jgi:hypothetical protein
MQLFFHVPETLENQGQMPVLRRLRTGLPYTMRSVG